MECPVMDLLEVPMPYLSLFAVVLFSALQVSSIKFFNMKYNRKTSDSVIFYCFIAFLAALVFFAVSGFSFNVSALTFGLAIIFGFSFTLTVTSLLKAIQCGSLALTNLIMGFGTILPVLFGVAFLKEKFEYTHIIGFVLFVTTIVLSAFSGETRKATDEKHRSVSCKWLICSLLAFLGNGISSTLLKYHQFKQPGSQTFEFMWVGFSTVTAIYMAYILILKFRKDDLDFSVIKSKGLLLNAVLCGIFTAFQNYGTLYLSSTASAIIVFPSIGAGSIIMTSLVTVLYFKEKMNFKILLCIFIGICGVVILNI